MIPTVVRAKIEDRFGIPITYSKDCEVLAKSIENACNERISATTLKRLFGFAKNIDHPRLYTFNVLAIYVGYKDWSSLLANIERTEKISGYFGIKKNHNEASSNKTHLLHHQISIVLATQTIDFKKVKGLCKQLGKQPEIIPFLIEIITIAARQKNVQFLKEVFNLPYIFNPEIHNSLEFYYVGQTMGLMLRQHPDIAEELIPALAANKNAQNIFIEWFVDEDYLQKYYGNLLDAYRQNKHKNVQDRLFYFALKYTQAVQYSNIEESKNWYKKIKELSITENIHHIPLARYVGICLSEEVNQFYNSASPYYKIILTNISSTDYQLAVGFSFYLCRELFRSNRTDWLIEVIKKFNHYHGKSINKGKTDWGVKMENQFLIYVAYVFQLLNQNKKAKQYLRKVDPNLFDPFIYNQMHQDYISVSEKLKGK